MPTNKRKLIAKTYGREKVNKIITGIKKEAITAINLDVLSDLQQTQCE
jgi:hypothetical protein